MDCKIILTVKYHDECLLVSVTQDSSYIDFIKKLEDKWGQPVLDNLYCRCTVGSVTNVCLSSDDDMKNLVTLCHFSAVNVVSVEIAHTNVATNQPVCLEDMSSYNISVPEVEYSNHQIQVSTNKRKPVLQMIEYCPTNDLPNYDICPAVVKKLILCDSWGDIMKGGVGSIFKGGAAEFREQLIKYSAHLGFKFFYALNDSKYIHVKCKQAIEANCRWLIKARRQPITNYFEIHTANLIHDCVGKLSCEDSRRLGKRIMSSLVFNTVKNNPSLTGKDLVGSIKESYGLQVPYWKAHRAVETAKSSIFGSYTDSYNHLRWYCRAIMLTNPGSSVSLEINPISHRFERVFIAFNACKEGFKHCRPMLFLDGTFMKGRARGTLLAATAKDENNGLFPVCFAIVSAENNENWLWFLENIRDNVQHDSQVCFISDRNLGLVNTFPLVFDDSQHFYCLYHLKTNLRARFASGWLKESREYLIDVFNQAAYAPTECLFQDKIKEFIGLGGETAVKWLESIEPYRKWAASVDTTVSRFGEMTSNTAESFNAWIKEARTLPITYMIETIRSDLSQWFVNRRSESDKWAGTLVPTKDNLWHVMVDDGRSWNVSLCPGGDYQVTSTPSVRVDLRSQECSCYQWTITGFPCVHAVAVIRRYTNDICTQVDPCFFKPTYKNTYMSNLNPIPETLKYKCQPDGQEPSILPPILNNTPGRPKKERIPSCGEGKKSTKKTTSKNKKNKFSIEDGVQTS